MSLVGETLGQFQQHFTSIVISRIPFDTKLQTQILGSEKSCVEPKESACKMLE